MYWFHAVQLIWTATGWDLEGVTMIGISRTTRATRHLPLGKNK